MNCRKNMKADGRGFTLIELMIVAVIIGVVATLAMPSFQNAYDRHKFQAGQKMVTSVLKKARSCAIAGKEPFGVHFNPETRAVTLFQNSTNPTESSFETGDSAYSVDTLPQEFQYVYADFDNGAIVFQPNGSAQLTGYGNIFLAGETANMMAYFSINILASTGRISTYSNYYAW